MVHFFLKVPAFTDAALEMDEELDDEDVLELELEGSKSKASEALELLSTSLHQNLRALIRCMDHNQDQPCHVAIACSASWSPGLNACCLHASSSASSALASASRCNFDSPRSFLLVFASFCLLAARATFGVALLAVSPTSKARSRV